MENDIDSSVCCEDFWEELFDPLIEDVKDIAFIGLSWFIGVPYLILRSIKRVFEN